MAKTMIVFGDAKKGPGRGSRPWRSAAPARRHAGCGPTRRAHGPLSNPLMARRQPAVRIGDCDGGALMEKIWLRQYPPGVPAEVRVDPCPSLVAMLDDTMRRHRQLPAFRFMGRDISYGQLDALSGALAAHLQSLGLGRGDRVAVMLPNVPQYPVAVAAILRAGCVVVNVNPLHGARELEHQLKDSGARAIVVIENLAARLQQVPHAVPTSNVVVAAMGDLLGAVKGPLVNQVVRRVRKLVPSFQLPGAVRFADALARGRRLARKAVEAGPEDIAVLQYTGGTTDVSKGVVLLHRNLVANVLQSQAWNRPALARVPAGEQPVVVCALPLHHIFAFSMIMLLGLHMGACSILVANAGDIESTLRQLSRHRFHIFAGEDALFGALVRHPDVDRVDWSHLQLSVGGGAAVQPATAQRWHEKTGCPVCEGYGLTETSPAVTCNPVHAGSFSGHVGLPLPGTELALLDDEGRPVAPGEPGEITIRGPQVMAGYWQRPEETARVMTADGWFRSGDIGVMDEQGCLRIVDRKKDTIRVSGCHVYPNEVEGIVTQMPGVLECAAVGVPDTRAGEAVKLVVVKQDPASASPSEAEIHDWCEARLSGHQRPSVVEFRTGLPRTPVGKVLRRMLRETV